jgi:hypothetical protein
MGKTLLESKPTHWDTGNPYILIKQRGKRYYLDVLNHAGDEYAKYRKGGIYDKVTYFDNYDDVENTFMMLALRYTS